MMLRPSGSNQLKWLGMLLAILMMTSMTSAQDVEARLAQKPDFTPKAKTVREQLIEVAQHYKIPMGIEWVIQPQPELASALAVEQPTVKAQIDSLLQSTPNYSVTVKDGIVHVSTKRFAADSYNFLNLRLGEFNVSKVNVFDAQARLRTRIHTTLHPERYLGGFLSNVVYGEVSGGDSLSLVHIL